MLHIPPWLLMFLSVGVLLAVIFSVALLLTPKPKRRWTKVTGVVVSLAVFGVLLVTHWFEPPMYQVHSEDDLVVTAFAPDGRTLILGGSDKIKLWDTHSHRETGTFSGHSGGVRCLAINPEGNLLASSGGTDKTIKLWRWPSGELVSTFKSNVDVRCLDFGIDGEFIAVAGSGPPILELRKVETGEEVTEPKLWFAVDDERMDFKEHARGGINDLAFAPDGKSLALAKASSPVLLCDLETGEVTLLPADVQGHLSVTFDPQGRYLAAADSFSDRVDLWDLQTKQRVFSRKGDGRHVAFSPDGKTLASAHYGIQLWDVPSGKLKAEFRYEQQTLFGSSRGSSITSLVFSPDEKTLVTGGINGTIMLWDAASLADDK